MLHPAHIASHFKPIHHRIRFLINTFETIMPNITSTWNHYWKEHATSGRGT